MTEGKQPGTPMRDDVTPPQAEQRHDRMDPKQTHRESQIDEMEQQGGNVSQQDDLTRQPL